LFAEMPNSGQFVASWRYGWREREIARKTVDIGWQHEPDSRVVSQKIR